MEMSHTSSQDAENANSESIRSSQQAQELRDALKARYPNQGIVEGFGGPALLNCLTWATVLELAKFGDFERIRPDILISHYPELKQINADFDAGIFKPKSVSLDPVQELQSIYRQKELIEKRKTEKEESEEDVVEAAMRAAIGSRKSSVDEELC